jgi:hypothetical protein
MFQVLSERDYAAAEAQERQARAESREAERQAKVAERERRKAQQAQDREDDKDLEEFASHPPEVLERLMAE